MRGEGSRGIEAGHLSVAAVVFDLDGTLLDTIEDLADATNAALKMNGMPERSVDEVRRFVGNGVANLILRAMPGGKVTDTMETSQVPYEHAKVLKCFKEYYGNIHYDTNQRVEPWRRLRHDRPWLHHGLRHC